jgi:enoyl-[acyl-carrier-protein] reductase (NADH)
MMAMTVDLPGWGAFMLVMFGLASTLGAAFAIARSSAAKSSVEILTTINVELRADNAELRSSLEEEKRFRLTDRHECEAQIAEMRGELNAVTNSIGESIGREVGHAVGRQVIEMLRSEIDRHEHGRIE